jgi:phosphoribosylanthranilate isomerase
VLVKICGITNLADAMLAVESGASALGFNFHAASSRYITPEAAAEITARIPDGVLKVGIFVEHSADEVKLILNRAGLDVAQVYGNAPMPGLRYWRVRRVDDDFDAATLQSNGAEAFLLDTPSTTMHGGSGQTFDWKRARGTQVRIVIAGGLDASNVRQAIEQARPWGVDACSRLEAAPGRKDGSKMKQFIEAALSI